MGVKFTEIKEYFSQLCSTWQLSGTIRSITDDKDMVVQPKSIVQDSQSVVTETSFSLHAAILHRIKVGEKKNHKKTTTTTTAKHTFVRWPSHPDMRISTKEP